MIMILTVSMFLLPHIFLQEMSRYLFLRIFHLFQGASKNHWELLQSMINGVFKGWKRDCLASLQQRTKWKTAAPNIQKDDVTFGRQQNTPGSWPSGCIMEIHPGKDGFVRIVTIKTNNSVFKDQSLKSHYFFHIRTDVLIGPEECSIRYYNFYLNCSHCNQLQFLRLNLIHFNFYF